MPTSDLPPFEGVPVLEATVRITKAGDGLSDALKLDPFARHVGEEGFYVIRTVCTQVNHRPLTPTVDHLRRVHTEEVTEIAMVTEADVKALLDANDQRLRKAAEAEARQKEAADGIARIPYGDELQGDHDAGLHADGLVENCPSCDDESAAALDGE